MIDGDKPRERVGVEAEWILKDVYLSNRLPVSQLLALPGVVS